MRIAPILPAAQGVGFCGLYRRWYTDSECPRFRGRKSGTVTLGVNRKTDRWYDGIVNLIPTGGANCGRRQAVGVQAGRHNPCHCLPPTDGRRSVAGYSGSHWLRPSFWPTSRPGMAASFGTTTPTYAGPIYEAGKG
jgi:hypothetical protein